ncbi:MAG TPA: methylenetetrahydrofolate reductase [NAD(P)H] [Deltaproteobacteria bacterium]|nr:methylenetetrahydrofolate reductase [NAD(P)H] [Deltaproteobacteria bacterium]HPR55001.1 methylenetetrahydrofolate reductase [NAD(P)H] [Deltaproteobacteria bacterium]HXK46338.1 methylenetetrahydrofolate reductase [NAD(P)H] [Deltaproteobacteria bacterium]
MLLKDILSCTPTTFSFEFFPPKTDAAWEHLFHTIADLMPLRPSWVSVTYGAGGSTRENTHRLVVRLNKQTDLTVVSHLTCVESTREDIHTILDRYAASGIENILALRGDPPAGQGGWCAPTDGFHYAMDLVSFIKSHFPRMSIGVAGFPEGHPETPNRLKEIDHLKAKIDAGADYIITQLFFENRDYYDFCERCELAGINVPIIAGIMPIITKSGMIRMAELAAGSRFPAGLLRAVNSAQTPQDIEKIGVEWAMKQVRDLLDNKARGVHFYTLNNARATLRIYEGLGISGSCSTGS